MSAYFAQFADSSAIADQTLARII